MKYFLIILFITLYSLKIEAQTVKLTSSNLPLLIVNTNGKNIVAEPKIDVHLGIINNESGMNNVTDPFNNYDGTIGIETRGNSSEGWPQKPYLFETRDKLGENMNVSLLGLPSENDWILHAPYVDKTCMRNALIYHILNEFGWYAPRTVFCEMIINNDYKGIYVLVEKLKIDKNRLNIEQASDSNKTGGFLLELTTSDRMGTGESFFTCSKSKKPVSIVYPKEEDLKPEQISYAKKCFDNFETALYNKSFSGTNDYKKYINVPSFIDHMLILELFRELDAFYASHYFNIDTDGKLRMGPGWDFNRAIGNYAGYDSYLTDNLWLIQPRGNEKTFWPNNIYQDATFMAQYKARYFSLRENIFSSAHIYSMIDEYAKLLDEATDRHFKRWELLGEKKNQPQAFDTYEGEVNYIKEWLAERFDFLDNEWNLDYYPIFNEIYVDGTNSGNQWIELFNPFPKAVDISGWKLKLSNNNKTCVLPANSKIGAGSYIIVCADKNKFLQAYHSVSFSQIYECLDLSINGDNFRLQLTNSDNVVKNEINVSIGGGWPMLSESGNFSIGVNSFQGDNKIGHNWNWSSANGGSPCEKNSLFDYSGLIINEVMSSNKNTIKDEQGDTGDWIELYNNSSHAINLAGLYLTDEVTFPWKSKIKGADGQNSSIIHPGEFVLFWADGDTTKGASHVDFKLNSDGGTVVLSYTDGFKYITIDKVDVPTLLTDYSYQRSEVTSNTWIETSVPSPRESNTPTDVRDLTSTDIAAKVYPNPTAGDFFVDLNLNTAQDIEISLFDFSGKQVSVVSDATNLSAGHYNFNVQMPNSVKRGMYVVNIKGKNFVVNKKVVLF